MLCFYQNPAGERVRKHDKDENKLRKVKVKRKKLCKIQYYIVVDIVYTVVP